MKYEKPPLTPEQCCETLKNRGLLIPDPARAIKYLKNIGYYRLTGYMFHLQSQDGQHTFAHGTTFDDIILIYQFDKKLRSIILEYLERIEICLKTKLTDHYSSQFGFFWYEDKIHFSDDSINGQDSIYETITNEVRDAFRNPKEHFLKKFKLKYSGEDWPPSNMALEILSLGKTARLFKGLKSINGKKNVADEFALPAGPLSTWFIYLANVRNVCAHHSRLWNKKITADRPSFPARDQYKFRGKNSEDSNTTLYGIISMIHRLLISFNPENSFTEKIEALIAEYNIDCNQLGFPEDWQTTANWKVK